MIQPEHDFAHVTAAQLSYHEQICGLVMGTYVTGLEP